MTACAFVRSSWSAKSPFSASKLVVRVRFPSPAPSVRAGHGLADAASPLSALVRNGRVPIRATSRGAPPTSRGAPVGVWCAAHQGVTLTLSTGVRAAVGSPPSVSRDRPARRLVRTEVRRAGRADPGTHRPAARSPAPQGAAPRADHLRELLVQRDALLEEIANEVERPADAGTSWPAIVAVLGVSRQAARQAALRRRLRRRTSR
jgi:hypothetical protein